MDVYDTYYFVTQRLMTILGIWPYQDTKHFPRATIDYFDQKDILNRLILFMIGVGPYENSKERFVRMCALTLFFTPLFVHQFRFNGNFRKLMGKNFYPLQIYQLCTMEFEMNLTIKWMQLFLPGLCTMITYYTFVYNFTTKALFNHEEVKLIYEHLKSDYDELLNDEEANIVRKYNKENRTYVLITAIIFNIYHTLIIYPSILSVILYFVGLSGDIQLILPIPVNYISDLRAFYGIFIYELIGLTVLTMIAFVTFTTYLILIQHACNQFSILIIKTHQPFKKKQNCIEQYFYYSGPQKEYDWIVDIINRYIKTTQFVDLINSLSEVIYLIEIFFGMIMIVIDFIYTFQISVLLENTSETVACCTYIFTTVFLMYINFYIGQKLLDHSNATHMEFCKVPFYALTIETQKLFLFIITRSMKSAELSIGGLFVSSHEVFAALIQKAFSIATFYRFYTCDFDMKSIVEEFQIFIPLLSSLYCYYNIIFHFELTKKLCDHVICDCNHLSNEQEIIIMQKYAKENKLFTAGIALIFYMYVIFLTSPSISYVFLYITGVVNDTRLTLPLSIDTLLFDKRSFYLIFFIQLFVLWILTTVAVVNYTTFLLCVTHACALLTIIIKRRHFYNDFSIVIRTARDRFKIKQPLRKNLHELSYDWSSIATSDVYNWIKDIVSHHVNVTEFVDLFNNLCEEVYLTQLILGTLCFTVDCIYMFQISDLIENIYKTFLYIIYVGGSVITIYLNCYIGQRLIDHSTTLSENLYQVSFYQLPRKYQKDLPMILMRSIKPCALSFKGIYVISNDLFARFIQTSLSYAMIYHT
ncbi:uncharacterized protein V1478_018338 [Vespula squamosa]|uniref:Odorant receptor n=1 Tax=Vespula squamosa TaxID=30214 RepID=A0ABD1ZUS6_VESSQ